MEINSLKEKISLSKKIDQPEIITKWASVHLVFCQIRDTDKPFLSMIKRKVNPSDPWSGHYAFPGGGVEERETLKEAAFRETFEEVGIDIPIDCYGGEFFRLQVKKQGKPLPFAISSHVSFMTTESLPTFNECPNEVESAFWFPLEKLLNPEHITVRNFTFPWGSYDLPCICFEEHVIWGISYMILHELLGLWNGEKITEKISITRDILPPYPYSKGRAQND